MSTLLNLPYKRFVRQVTRGSLASKSSFIAMEDINLVKLKNAVWKSADESKDVTTVTNSIMASNGKLTTYIDDKYDAYKQGGDGVAASAQMCAYAGCVAYQFKLPEFDSVEDSSPIEKIDIPITLDRYQRSGVKVSLALSELSVPDGNWDVIRGEVEGAICTHSIPVVNVTGVKSWGFGASRVDNLLASAARNEICSFVSEDGTSPIFTAEQVFGKKYLYVYMSIEDYTDYWNIYDATGTPRAYNIEGSAMIVGTAVSTIFTKDNVPMPKEKKPTSTSKIATGLGALITTGVAAGVSVFVATSAPEFDDADGDLMPDTWEEGFANLSASTNNADYCIPGDVMAYAEVSKNMLVLSNATDGASFRICASDNAYSAGDTIPAGTKVWDLAEYGDKTFALTKERALTEVNHVKECTIGVKLIAVHATVYKLFGFDPSTANPTVTNGVAVNTKPFTALDKYLVARYLNGLGLCDEKAMITNQTYSSYTLMPGNPDYNGDGIPDGWELYTMFTNLPPSSLDQASISPFATIKGVEASSYVRDATYSPEGPNGLTWLNKYNDGNVLNPWSLDSDGDGITDKASFKWGLADGRSRNDNDNDGLSNYDEYRASQIYPSIRVDNPKSCVANQAVPDYFMPTNSSADSNCLGYLFTDHDYMEDWWEDEISTLTEKPFVSRYVWDMYDDEDGDGWSNYAECRAGTSPATAYRAVDFGGEDGVVVLPEHPMPIIPIVLRYNGMKDIHDKKILIKAWNQKNINEYFNNKPEAAWVIDQSSKSDYTKYIGYNTKKELSTVIGPGFVAHGGVHVYFKDPNEIRGGKPQTIETAKWTEFIKDVPVTLEATEGNFVTIPENGEPQVVGRIDYKTGEARIDFSKLIGKVNFPSQTNIIDLASSLVKIAWKTEAFNFNENNGMLLSNILNDGAVSKGTITEGSHIFTAYVCEDDSYEHIASAPFGCCKDINIGYSRSDNVEIELTDCSPSIVRIDLLKCLKAQEGFTGSKEELFAIQNGFTDRGVNSTDRYCDKNGLHQYSGNSKIGGLYDATVKISRQKINHKANASYVEQVYEQKFNLNEHPVLTEMDIWAQNNYVVIDRALFKGWTGVAAQQITNASYTIEISNYTNYTLSVEFHNIFTFGVSSPAVSPIVSELICNTSRPVFQWKNNSEKIYPAFSYDVYIIENNGRTTNSLIKTKTRKCPISNKDGVYCFSPTDVGLDILYYSYSGRFSYDKKYLYKVNMIDDKFISSYTDEKYPLSFVENKNKDYGSIDLSVKYIGNNVTTILDHPDISGIEIQAYTSPDFTGDFVSCTEATSESITNVNSLAINATLRNLPIGHDYYIKGVYRTWKDYFPLKGFGYVNHIGEKDEKYIYSPKAVTLPGKLDPTSVNPKAVLYILDME